MLRKYLSWILIVIVSIETDVWAASQGRRYPRIRPTGISVETSASKPEAAEALTIYDSLGKPAYELSISAVSEDKQTTTAIFLRLSTTGRYSPDPEEKYEPNLLKADYWGHGEGPEVIHPEWLCPANKGNSFYGARREFILRRMKIIVEISDFEFSSNFCPRNKCEEQKGGLSKAKLKINVLPNDSRRRRPIDAPYKIKPCE